VTATPAPYDLLASRTDRSSPFVTGYDGPTQVVELSVVTSLNNVAKAAGLLRDEVGLAPGDRLSLDLPLHWQLPMWILAGLSVGLQCGYRTPGRVEARLVGPQGLERLAAGAPPDADEVLGCSCDAFGMPVPGGVPMGVIDVGVAARAHPDVLSVEPAAVASAAILLPEVRPEAVVAGYRAVRWSDLVAAGPLDPPGARTWVTVEALSAAGLPPAALLRRAAIDPLLRVGSVVLARRVPPADAARLRSLQGAVPDAPATV
jgi:uncharacterized protein (TIGR03089 family)